MRRTKSISLAAAAALTLGLGMAASAGAANTAAAAPDVVDTEQGPVRGTVGEQTRSFQGIPYAAPPVDEKRWEPPSPVEPWDEVRDATSPGEPCAQPEGGPPIGKPTDNEDCLYLNVTTPVEARGDLPVIVWIHGGSMMHGMGDMYGPERLSAGGAVVVSMNYRLGVMSFLADPALAESGSLALEDQQAALRWVRENAAAFGGDGANVTIMGQSGGGYGVCGHLSSPMSEGLFDRAIVQSAPCATGGSRTRAEAEADSERVIKGVDCEENTAACLRDTPAADLLAAYGAFNEPRPISGTELLPLPPEKALRTGRFNRVPVLIGLNHDEENGMVLGEELASEDGPMRPEDYEPVIRKRFGAKADAVLDRYPLSDFSSAGEALATVRTDANWAAPTLDTARLLARWTPTRMYEFSESDTPWFKGYPEPSFKARAQHMAELPYLFDLALYDELTAKQRRLGDRMIRTWVGFAESGRTDWRGFGRKGYVQTIASGPWKRTEFVKDHQYDFWTD